METAFDDLDYLFSHLNKQQFKYPYNQYKTDAECVFEFALAGCNKEDIKFECGENLISIVVTPKKHDREYITQRISEKPMIFKIGLADKHDKAKIVANMENGMLTVVIPFKESEKFDVKFK